MAPKRHSTSDTIERNDQMMVHNETMPLLYADQWKWSKRHRSQEVLLDSTCRKGNALPTIIKVLRFMGSLLLS